MSKRKFFKPAIQGRNLGVDLKVGEEKDIHVDIPPSGYRAETPKIEKALLEHELYGHSFGFIYVEESTLKNQKAPQFNGEASVDNKRPEAAKASKVEIIEEEEDEEPDETDSEKEEDEGESDPDNDSEKEESSAAEKVEDTNGDGKITVEDATKWQQAKDYLINELGVDGRTINSPAKVKEEAEKQEVNFPNVNWE